MTELQSLLSVLPESWRHAALSLIVFIGVARVVVKPFGELLKRLITRACETAIQSANKDDDHWIEVVLRSLPYRIAAFLFDYLVSVKLTRFEDLFSGPLPPPQPTSSN